MNSESRAWYLYTYTVPGLVQDGRTNKGGRHQVLGGLEWVVGRGGVRCGG
jgi:hypothetical protein